MRRSRRRFWKSADVTDSDKRSAYDTLYTALETLARLIAKDGEGAKKLVNKYKDELPIAVYLGNEPHPADDAQAESVDDDAMESAANAAAGCQGNGHTVGR